MGRLVPPARAHSVGESRYKQPPRHFPKTMKRSERFFRTARHEAMMGVMFLTVCIAAGVWAVAALQSGNVSGGTALIAGAALALCLASMHGRECVRCWRIAERETLWELRSSIRPRL